MTGPGFYRAEQTSWRSTPVGFDKRGLAIAHRVEVTFETVIPADDRRPLREILDVRCAPPAVPVSPCDPPSRARAGET